MASYEHLILIHENSNFDFEELIKKIETINWGSNKVVIKTKKDSAKLLINDWEFELAMDAATHIQEESIEMADEFASSNPLKSKIASCSKRLLIGGTPDYDMEYFNDFVFVLEKIESFSDVYTFNPYEGFLNI